MSRTVKLIVVFFFPSNSRYLGKNDCLTISVWNQKKVHKKQGAGFLGCVKILPSLIHSFKDTSCKYNNCAERKATFNPRNEQSECRPDSSLNSPKTTDICAEMMDELRGVLACNLSKREEFICVLFY